MAKSPWDEGQEPDYRFTLANERTFLAWIRTALALLAGGVLLDQFSTRLQPAWMLLALAICLCAGAAMVSAFAYRRWRQNQLAMRRALPLPRSGLLLLLTGLLLAAAGTLAVLLLIR